MYRLYSNSMTTVKWVDYPLTNWSHDTFVKMFCLYLICFKSAPYIGCGGSHQQLVAALFSWLPATHHLYYQQSPHKNSLPCTPFFGRRNISASNAVGVLTENIDFCFLYMPRWTQAWTRAIDYYSMQHHWQMKGWEVRQNCVFPQWDGNSVSLPVSLMVINIIHSR